MKFKGIQVLIALFSLFVSESIFANSCTALFPAAIQSNFSNQTISFTCGCEIINNPTTVLQTKTVTNPSGCSTKTCATANCSAVNTFTSTISPGSFQTSSGAGGSASGTVTLGGTNNTITDYTTVSIGNNQTLGFSASTTGTTTYRINTLTLNKKAIVNLIAGDYWINTLTLTGSGSGTVSFVVQGGGTARVFINNSPNINQQVSWNTAGSASNLLIYSYDNITIIDSGMNSAINAIIYAVQDYDLEGVTITGALNGGNYKFAQNATVTYDQSAVNALDWGPNFSGCTSSAATQFAVTAPATGTNCQNMTITTTAQNSAGQTATGYTGAITLTTQNTSGTWVSSTGHGTFTGGSSGTATYQFVAADNGAASFQLNYPSTGASPLTLEAYQTNNSSIKGFSGAVNFIPAGILVSATAVSQPPASPPPAFSTTETAGNNFTLYLTAYNPSSCGIVTSYTGTKTLRFYTTYVNPSSGTLKLKINGTEVANSVGATQTTQAITFTNGAATVTGMYPDAGQLSLTVTDTSAGGPTGSSGNFAVIPAKFAINIPGNSATQTTSPSNAAVSACLADTVFKNAGGGFTVNVQPQNSLGNVTPNYGNESQAEGILLQSVALLAPSGGRNGSSNNGAIGNGSAFTKITGSAGPFASAPYFTGSTFYFDEVGCINLSASIKSGNYLGVGGNVSSTTVVGRFTPDHFSVSGNTPQFGTININSAGAFTYLNQPFFYITSPIMTVTAVAATGSTTQNYTGSFWKLASTGFGTVYNMGNYPVTAGDTIPPLTLSATIPAPTFVDGGSGSGTFTFGSGSGLQIVKNASINAPPLTAELQLKIAAITDSDAVACSGSGCVSGGYPFGNTTSGNGISFSGTDSLHGKEFLHGRLAVIDALGSQALSLTVPMQLQYYTSNGFVLNSMDSTTVFNGGVSSLSLTPTTGLTTTATMPAPPTFQSGVLNINLTAPNTQGSVTIQANLGSAAANLPWLQYAWPDSTNPLGLATFGIAGGNNRIIYQRENTK